MAPDKAINILGIQLQRFLQDNPALRQYSPDWQIDSETKFIFKVKTYLDLLERLKCVSLHLHETAIRRWYNWRISAFCEWYLCLADGIEPEPIIGHRTIDLYVDGVEFDVKVTVLPKECRGGAPRDVLNHLYVGQSKGKRWAENNRLITAVDGTWKDKADLTRLAQAMDRFLENRNDYLVTGKRGLVAGLIVA